MQVSNGQLRNWLKSLDPSERNRQLKSIAKCQEASGMKCGAIQKSLEQLSQNCLVRVRRLSQEDVTKYTSGNLNLWDAKSMTSKKKVKYPPCKTKNKRSATKKYCKRKQVLNTTVNVNIYNSSNRCCETENLTVKEKNNNELLNLHDPPTKKLRIDVSLSEENLEDIEWNKLCLDNISKKEKRKSKKVYDSSKSKRHGHKPIFLNLKSVNIEEDDDPSVKEIWTILGMETPTEKSDKIKSFSSSSEVLPSKINNKDPDRVDTDKNMFETISFLDNDSNSSNSDQTIESHGKENVYCSNLLPINSTKSEDRIEIMSSSDHDGNTSNVIQDTNKTAKIHSEKEIVNHFVNSISSNMNRIEDSIAIISLSGDSINNSDAFQNKAKEVQSSSTIISKTATETVLLSNNTSTSQLIHKAAESNDINKETSKVGKIRVKDIKSLQIQPNQINPLQSNSRHQEQQTELITTRAYKATSVPIDDKISSPSPFYEQEQSITIQPNLVNKFCVSYHYHFNKFVESNIPRLGEILHLAVADLIRVTDQVKRAEQLSSEELITEEKEMAERTFNHMMRIRSAAFTPVFANILNFFEESSRLSLFLALFYRIVRYIERIDPSNKNCVLETKIVAHAMLIKERFMHRSIAELLAGDVKSFGDKLEQIGNIVESFIPNKFQGTNSYLAAASQQLLGRNIFQRNEQDAIHSAALNVSPVFATLTAPDISNKSPQHILEHSQRRVAHKPLYMGNGVISPYLTNSSLQNGHCETSTLNGIPTQNIATNFNNVNSPSPSYNIFPQSSLFSTQNRLILQPKPPIMYPFPQAIGHSEYINRCTLRHFHQSDTLQLRPPVIVHTGPETRITSNYTKVNPFHNGSESPRVSTSQSISVSNCKRDSIPNTNFSQKNASHDSQGSPNAINFGTQAVGMYTLNNNQFNQSPVLNSTIITQRRPVGPSTSNIRKTDQPHSSNIDQRIARPVIVETQQLSTYPSTPNDIQTDNFLQHFVTGPPTPQTYKKSAFK